MKPTKKIKNSLKTILSIWQEFNNNECWLKAANLAYITLLSIVPLFTVSFSMLAAFPVFKEMSTKIQTFIFANLVTESAETVQQYFQSFISQTNQLSIFGLFFLLITAVLLIFSMEQTFNDIWHVKRNRRGMTAFLLYWAVISLSPIAIATILWAAMYLGSIPFITGHTSVHIKNLLVFFVPYIITFLALMSLYIYLPNRKVPLKSAAIAAIIATILFEISRRGFSLYITHLATYKLIYGAIATIPIFLLWLYITWLVILFGVVVSVVITNNNSKPKSLFGRLKP